MIIRCEKCQTAFNLDESLIKKEGSKVRCSLCKHVFLAYPRQGASSISETRTRVEPRKPQETTDKASAPFFNKEATEIEKKDQKFEADLDSLYKDVFEQAPADLSGEKTGLSENAYDSLEETAREEGQTASRPAADFPDLDTVDINGEAYIGEGAGVTQAKKRRSGVRFLTVFLFIILLLLSAAAAVIFFRPELIPPSLSFLRPPEKSEPADPGTRLLVLKEVSGSFTDSEKGGRLFVIRGIVHNRYPTPRSHIYIKGSILNDKGQVIKTVNAYAGNTFTEDEIKILPLEEIRRAMKNRNGMARRNFRVLPEATIPFMIVFEHLPEKMSEFTVEAVSSSPGT